MLETMESASKKIVISGYYGFRNSGDEAVLQSILIALEQQAQTAGIRIEPIVLSIDPEWTSATYGVQAVHRMKPAELRRAIAGSDGLISGGGSLLQDVTGTKSIPYYIGVIKLAQWLRKPVFIYAQGIGPVNRKLFYPLIKSAFRKSRYISVRDEQSRSLLGTMGLNLSSVQVVPDPVMGLRLPGQASAGDQVPAGGDGKGARTSSAEPLPTVGISVRFWETDRKELQTLSEAFVLANRKQPLHLRFLPFHLPSDVEASRYMMERIETEIRQDGGRISLCEQADHPLEMLKEVASCDALIGMRLHSLIYAAGQRVPLLGVSYDPKIDQFLKRIDCSPVGSTNSLSSESTADAILHLIENGDSWKATREPLIAGLVEAAETPARTIVEYLRHKG